MRKNVPMRKLCEQLRCTGRSFQYWMLYLQNFNLGMANLPKMTTMCSRHPLQTLQNCGGNAGISEAPKVHSLLCHMMEQMKAVWGFGDMLEWCIAQLKNDVKKAESQSAIWKADCRIGMFNKKLSSHCSNLRENSSTET